MLFINKILLFTFGLFVAICTSELVVFAKQTNYFEMFMLSICVECRNSIVLSKRFKKIKKTSKKLICNNISLVKFNPISLLNYKLN